MTLFTSFQAQGQPNSRDSTYIDGLNLKAWQLRKTDLESSKEIAGQSVRFAREKQYNKGLAQGYNVLGHYFKVKSRYDSAFYFYEQSLLIRLKMKDTLGTGICYRNISSIYKLRDNIPLAIETAVKGIQLLAMKAGDKDCSKEKARLQLNLATLYLKTGKYDQAITEALSARGVFLIQDSPEDLALTAITLGSIYEARKDYKKALPQLQEALRLYTASDNQRELAKVYNNIGTIYQGMKNYEEALIYYQKALRLREVNGYDDDLRGSMYNIGVIYESVGQHDSAYSYYNKALALNINSGNAGGQAEALLALGGLLHAQKKNAQAIDYLKRSLQLSDETGNISLNLMVMRELFGAYREEGNTDSALFYSEKYTDLNDSLNTILRNSIQQEAAIAEKDAIIRENNYKLMISEAANKKRDIVIISMTLALFLFLIIFLLHYRFVQSRKKNLELSETIKDKELKAFDALLEGQEEERKRLSAELHDTIGSMLSATKYAFKAMEKRIGSVMTEDLGRYQKINTMLDETMDSVRKISHTMATGTFTDKSIEQALQDLTDTFEQTGKLKIMLSIHGFSEKPGSSVEMNLYRMIQELLNNILKHAHAKEVTIQLIKSSGNINLVVEDDGIGFDPEEVRRKKGIGLSNVTLRVKKLSGNLNIDTGKGRGTTIIIDIPINEEAD